MKKSEFLISKISIGKLNGIVSNFVAQTRIPAVDVVNRINNGSISISIVEKWKIRTTKDSYFYLSEISTGQLNAMMKNIMNQIKIYDPFEIVSLVNSGQIQMSIAKQFEEKDEIIYFSVTSDGSTGPDWVNYFGEECLSRDAKNIILSQDFKPTKDVTYNVAVLMGRMFSDTKVFNIGKVVEEAERQKFSNINTEAMCLIRRKFQKIEIRDMEIWGIASTDIFNKNSVLYISADSNMFPFDVLNLSNSEARLYYSGFAFIV